MRLIGWEGYEAYDEEESVSSLSIGSDDSAEEYYDTRSRWLYAHVAALQRNVSYKNISGPYTKKKGINDHRLQIDYLAPAPSVEYQFRQARWRILNVIRRLDININLQLIKLSVAIKNALGPGLVF